MSVLTKRECGQTRLLHHALTGVPIVALLLLAACSSTGAAPKTQASPHVTTPGLSVTPAATATVAPLVSQPLSWQPTAASPTVTRPAYVAPTDGNTAYLCQPSDDDLSGANAPGVPAKIWSTHDRGAHWLRQADVPVAVNRNDCQIVVDALNPNTAAVVLDLRLRGSGGGGGDPTTTLNYATLDGGASWRLLPASDPYAMDQLATRNGVTYALRSVLQGNAVTTHLWSSADGMRTWVELGMQIPTELGALWLNPATGALLVDGTDFDRSHTLWKSEDGGKTFSELALTDTRGFVAQIPIGATDWTICTATYDVQSLTNQENALTCSTDGGATWQTRSDASTAALPVDDFTSWTGLLAIAKDGSLLGVVSQGDTPALVRLPAGASAWLSLGSASPYATFHYGGGPGNGVIWQFASRASTSLVP